VIGLFLAIFVQQSHAYVPPVKFVIEQLGKKRDNVRTARVVSQVSPIRMNQEDVGALTETTQVDLENEVLLSTASPDPSNRLSIRMPGSILVFGGRVERISSVLEQLGVPMNGDPGRIKRWDNHIVWVFGSKEKGLSELWVEKDSFLPLRLIWKDQEIQFREWRISDGGFLFPMDQTFYRAGEPRLHVTVKDIVVNKPITVLRDPAMAQPTARMNEARTEYFGIFR
jgi:hypothetical protein